MIQAFRKRSVVPQKFQHQGEYPLIPVIIYVDISFRDQIGNVEDGKAGVLTDGQLAAGEEGNAEVFADGVDQHGGAVALPERRNLKVAHGEIFVGDLAQLAAGLSEQQRHAGEILSRHDGFRGQRVGSVAHDDDLLPLKGSMGYPGGVMHPLHNGEIKGIVHQVGFDHLNIP